MSASEASKPYIDATERSIELNFRSLEYQNDRLNKVALSATRTIAHAALTAAPSSSWPCILSRIAPVTAVFSAGSIAQRANDAPAGMEDENIVNTAQHTQHNTHSTTHTAYLPTMTNTLNPPARSTQTSHPRLLCSSLAFSLLVCSHDLVEPKTWQTRSDLQTYLGALAVMGRQKGGGRVFSKEKHSYFDHDDSHSLQQSHSRAGNRTAADDGDEDEDGEGDRAGKKAEQREEEKQQHEEEHRQPTDNDEDDGVEDVADFSVPLGASADISGYISERLQSRQRDRTLDIGAPPITQHPATYSTRASLMLGAAHASFLTVDEHKEHFSPRRSLTAAHDRSGHRNTSPLHITPLLTSPPFYSATLPVRSPLRCARMHRPPRPPHSTPKPYHW